MSAYWWTCYGAHKPVLEGAPQRTVRRRTRQRPLVKAKCGTCGKFIAVTKAGALYDHGVLYDDRSLDFVTRQQVGAQQRISNASE